MPPEHAVGALAQAAADLPVEPLLPGRQVTAEEYTLLAGPVLAQIFFDRREVSDSSIDTVVTQWLATLDRAAAR